MHIWQLFTPGVTHSYPHFPSYLGPSPLMLFLTFIFHHISSFPFPSSSIRPTLTCWPCESLSLTLTSDPCLSCSGLGGWDTDICRSGAGGLRHRWGWGPGVGTRSDNLLNHLLVNKPSIYQILLFLAPRQLVGNHIGQSLTGGKG